MRGALAFALPGLVVLAWLSPLAAAVGQGSLADAALQQASAAAATEPAAASLRAATVAVLLSGALVMLWRLRSRRAALGRAVPPLPFREVDTEWLDRRVFSHAPELVGALYDGRIAGREVAALLARMSVESKLASRVATGSRGWGNLELWLLVERDELADHERELVDRLFSDRKTTSGDAVRAEYEAIGFEPAGILRRHLAAQCDALLGVRATFTWPLRVGLAASAVGLASALRWGVWGVLPVVFAAAFGALAPLSAARFGAAELGRRGPGQLEAQPWAFAISAGVSIIPIGLLIGAWPLLPPLGALAFALWGLVSAALAARLLTSRYSPGGLALRHDLLAARQYFAAELERPRPRIQDDWLPYLIALDLTKEVEHWHLAFGRLDTAARREQQAELSESIPAGSPSLGEWTGGGGAFGGVGASGPRIAAAASLTVPVPARQGAPLPQRSAWVRHAIAPSSTS